MFSSPAIPKAPRPFARRECAELAALRERGITVDIPQSRLPLPEFYQRAAREPGWSGRRRGWAGIASAITKRSACGSVPVINQPTIERHRPLVAGEHAFYYDPAPGELTRTIVAALADKERLRTMARMGQVACDGPPHARTHWRDM